MTTPTSKTLVTDLGGHDLAFPPRRRRVRPSPNQPSVVFAYTIKGYGLPIAGDGLNHSALSRRPDRRRPDERQGSA
ncbi:MAG: hypothetical protein R2697_20475 [Ilumatobacteraceae bacterium]